MWAPAGRFGPWSHRFTIVRNLCVDRLRSMSKLDVVDPHEQAAGRISA